MKKILNILGPTFLSFKEFGFAYGLQGSLVRRNLEKLWFQHCITMAKHNVFFIHSNNLMSNINDISDVGLDNVPFGIAEIDEVKNTWNESIPILNSRSISHRVAKITTVYESDDSIISVKDLFYKKQRERKSWWRKISENPSIYFMSEIKRDKGKEYAEIEARFPFGNIVVETLNFKNSAKKLLPSVENSQNLKIVEHTLSLDWGCLTLLCDGYIEIEDSKELQMHPKLLPYKAYCKPIISPSDEKNIQEDVCDLSIYITDLLRKQGIDSILMNEAKKPEIFRVPYVITVDSESLKTGLCKLNCQRTLCGEIVHITDLAKRVSDYCI
ncbi:hypothetical protein TKK_0017405 [Trichogramma kaykai]